MGKVKIGIVAPASRIQPDIVPRITALAASLYGDRVELVFHPNNLLVSGHFAGDDAARTAAFLDIAKTPEGRALLSITAGNYQIDDMKAVTDDLYEPLRQMVKTLKLNLNEMVGK